MGRFSELFLSEASNLHSKRKFDVIAQDHEGKPYAYEHEGYSSKTVHADPKFKGDQAHKIVSIKHNGKDVTTESIEDLISEDMKEDFKKRSTFHDYNAMPHPRVRISGEHKEVAKNLKDGEKHTSSAHHLITTYDHNKIGTSHWADSHRDGGVVHLRDHYTNKHIATISHDEISKED